MGIVDIALIFILVGFILEIIVIILSKHKQERGASEAS